MSFVKASNLMGVIPPEFTRLGRPSRPPPPLKASPKKKAIADMTEMEAHFDILQSCVTQIKELRKRLDLLEADGPGEMEAEPWPQLSDLPDRIECTDEVVLPYADTDQIAVGKDFK